jgi:hypothetical protein
MSLGRRRFVKIALTTVVLTGFRGLTSVENTQAQQVPEIVIAPAPELLTTQVEELRKQLLAALEDRNVNYLGLGEQAKTEGKTIDINYLLQTIGELSKTESGSDRGQKLASVISQFLERDNSGWELTYTNQSQLIEATQAVKIPIQQDLNGVSGNITSGNRSEVFSSITQQNLSQKSGIKDNIKSKLEGLFNKFLLKPDQLRYLKPEEYSKFGPELLQLVERLSPKLRADALYYLSRASMTASSLFARSFGPYRAIPELKDPVVRGDTVNDYLTSENGKLIERQFENFYAQEAREIATKINTFASNLNSTQKETFYSFFIQN